MDSPPDHFGQIDLQQLPPWSALLNVPSPPGWRDRIDAGETCPALTLRGEDGMDRLPKRHRAGWRYALRRLERDGGSAELVADEGLADAGAELAVLHARRWAGRGQPGVLSDPLLAGFIGDALPALAGAGLLRLHRLRKGGATVALLLAVRGHRRTCYYLSGFDPAHSAASPGTILVGLAIRHAAREGDEIFDFLRGREPYKYGWGAEDVPTARRVMTG
jgi:CelD/BcsL family acetyltransferase involved in cellulose biosynthesis